VVWVPLIDIRGDAAVRLGEALDGGDG